MTTFIHTSDWQIGMTRHFLHGEAQARYTEARLDAIRAVATLADNEGCAFVVVAGDIFESNFLDRRTVVRALDAIRTFSMPVYLLPGNHDPFDASSIYRSSTFVGNCPDHVTVLSTFDPVEVPGTDITILGAPWDSKRPLEDLVAKAMASATVARRCVVVAHGIVDTMSPDKFDPAIINQASAESVVGSRGVEYVALGDRHSTTCVGDTGRIWYSGTPLVTDYDETDPNKVLVVTLDGDGPSVAPRAVGTWRFLLHRFDLNGTDDVDAMASELESLDDKTNVVVKISCVGTLNLAAKARLDENLELFAERFSALETWERRSDLVVLPDDTDLSDLGLSGYAADAMEELTERAKPGSPGAEEAADALALLYRLAKGVR